MLGIFINRSCKKPFFFAFLCQIAFIGNITHAFADKQISPPEIYAKNKDNVRTLVVYDSAGQVVSKGTAVYLFSNYFVTNTHVVEEGSSASLLIDDEVFEAYEVMTSPNLDISYFRIQESVVDRFGFHQVEYSLDIEVASEIFVISSPLDYSQSITQGIISADRDDLIQHTAPISPGSSGGGLFNANGELIGIVNARSSNDSNISFAIKMERVLFDLMQNNEDLLLIYESPPLLSGKALLSMRTLHEGLIIFSLIDLSSIEILGDKVNFISSSRTVIFNDEGRTWLELVNENSLDCKKRQLLSNRVGISTLTSNDIERMDGGELDGKWIDTKNMPNKTIYDSICGSRENIWMVKATLRRIHNAVQPLTSELVYKEFEVH